MSYYFAKSLSGNFDTVIGTVTAALKREGFGVLSDLDITATLKEKTGTDFRPYRILGACNPPLALKALNAEDRIGLMLPCNVIVQDRGGGQIEVAAINPTAAMGTIENTELTEIAGQVAVKLERVIAAL